MRAVQTERTTVQAPVAEGSEDNPAVIVIYTEGLAPCVRRLAIETLRQPLVQFELQRVVRRIRNVCDERRVPRKSCPSWVCGTELRISCNQILREAAGSGDAPRAICKVGRVVQV